MNTSQPPPASRPSALGLPLLALVGLALIAAPRVVLHDLHLIQEGTLVNALLVLVPPAVWVAVVVGRRVPNPFLTTLVIGALYGVFLAIGHQVLWEATWRGNPPQLGGNLQQLSPSAQGAVLRGFAAVSSVFTGVMVGAVTGLVAWGASALLHRRRADVDA